MHTRLTQASGELFQICRNGVDFQPDILPIPRLCRQVVLRALSVRPWDLEALKRRYHPAVVIALFGFLSGSITIGMLACMAHLAASPLVFPSLGPTAFLLFYKPLSPPASPRNTIIGHLIGALAGWVSLLIFGLVEVPGSPLQEISWARMGAAALSIGVTIGLMELWDVPHPPAGATTMIVSLGLMSHLWQLGVLMSAVVALVALGWAINHLVGIPYPLWAPLPASSDGNGL